MTSHREIHSIYARTHLSDKDRQRHANPHNNYSRPVLDPNASLAVVRADPGESICREFITPHEVHQIDGESTQIKFKMLVCKKMEYPCPPSFPPKCSLTDENSHFRFLSNVDHSKTLEKLN
jgi:hypothetical protein